MVHISNLGDDYYQYDNQKGMLIGENTRTIYRLGDKVKVSVKTVDLDERKIDLTLLGAESPTGKQRKRNSGKTQRKKSQGKSSRGKGSNRNKPRKGSKNKGNNPS